MSTESGLKYYAYISAHKVDLLYDQLVGLKPSRLKVSRGSETDTSINGGISKLVAFLSADLKYGHRRHGQFEIEGQIPLVQKLKTVLEHIRKNEHVKDLNSLCEAEAGEPLDAFAYTYSGTFTAFGRLYREKDAFFYEPNSIHLSGSALERAQDDIIISQKGLIDPGLTENRHPDKPSQETGRKMVSNICLLYSKSGRYMLELSCSYKYFSDMGVNPHGQQPNNEWEVVPHSGNIQFFIGKADAHFDALLFINDVRERHIFATPLFLVFRPDPLLAI